MEILPYVKFQRPLTKQSLEKLALKFQMIAEEQNGFRASPSYLDHLFVLVSILRNRKALGLNTFLSFIDFQKAFDSVDRNLLFFKLSQIGGTGKFYNAIQAMYTNPKSKILLNEFETDFFNCPIDIKQGDCISATLFSIFINDLAEEIKNTKVGIDLTENVANDMFKDEFKNLLINI